MHPWFDDIGSTISSINADSGIPVVLRVLVLIEVLTSPSSKGVGSAQFLTSDSLTVKGKQQAIEEFFRELKLVSRPTEKGVALVNKKNIQNGIFYQDLLAVFGDNSSKLETGYISYGLFEDLFLNSLIAENSKTDIHNVRFNTNSLPYISFHILD